MRLPRSGPGSSMIVLGVDDVTPPLGVEDVQGNTELSPSLEAEGTGRSAATHIKYLGPVRFGPDSIVGVRSNGLHDDVEERVGVVLVEADYNIISHYMQEAMSL